MYRHTTILIFALCLFAAATTVAANSDGEEPHNIVFASDLTATTTTNTTNSTTKTNTTNTTNSTTKTNTTTNTTNSTTKSNTTNSTNSTNSTTKSNSTNSTNSTTKSNSTNSTNSTTKSNSTNSTNSTTNTTAAPSTFNNFCYACIFHNHTYCAATKTCLSANQTCVSGTVNNRSTGCPSTKMCDYGTSGYGYIGANLTKNIYGFNTTGSAAFVVPAGEPCVAAIVNANSSDLDISIIGNNVGAFSLTMALPFSSNYTMLNSSLRILPSYNVAYLYIGSTSNVTQVGGLVWSPHTAAVVPVTPTNNNNSSKSGMFMKSPIVVFAVSAIMAVYAFTSVF